MTGHLSHDQRSEYALGEAPAEVLAHLRACAACREEAQRFAAALGNFRDAVHAWSAAPAPRSTARAWRPALWAATGLTAAIIAILTGSGWRPGDAAPARPAPPARAAAEELEIPMARPVPRSMRPLTLLVAGTEFEGRETARERNEQ